MNNDVKGMCLFLGLIGLGYVLFLMIIMFLTDAKTITKDEQPLVSNKFY